MAKGAVNRALVLAAVAALAAASPCAADPVPFTMITIKGSSRGDGPAVSYRAYQRFGNRVRIVCQEPCTLSQALIDATYDGFAAVRPELVTLFGPDIMSAFPTYDIHLNGDSWCGPYTPNLTGDASTYPSYAGQTGVVSCFWDVEKTNRALPFTPENAIKREDQLVRVHEYGHGLFFGRHLYSYEDFVKSFSFKIAGLNGRRIEDPCDVFQIPSGQGRLPYTLCRAGGFRWEHLAPAMQALELIYNQGRGTASSFSSSPFQPRTSAGQLRRALADVIGRDTGDAFTGAYLSAAQSGGEPLLRPAGGLVRTGGGFLTLTLPPAAVASDTRLALEAVPTLFSAGLPYVDFAHIVSFTPAITLGKPATLALRYEPGGFPNANTREGTLRLYQYNGSSWSPVPGSTVDVVNRVVGAPVTALGVFGISGPTDPSPEKAARVIATVASNPGQNGSYFRTETQIHNASTSGGASGKLVFHPREQPARADDPSYSYSLSFRQTLRLADLLVSLGSSGNGSVDVVPSSGPVPVVLTRVFNDLGAAGTFGVGVDALPPDAALRTGERGVLLAPPDTSQRINVGVRSLSEGATVTFTVKSASGQQLKSLSRTYQASYFEQRSLSEVLNGFDFSGNESLSVTVTAGAAIVYGAVGDNRTSDPSLQIARPLTRPGRGAGELLTLPTIASLPGQFGSFFRTTAQLHNPTDATLAGRLVFHVAGTPATPGDPSLPYSLAPGRTVSYDDLLPAMGQAGSGSVDVVPSAGAAPYTVVRVFNDGASGRAGLSYEAQSYWDALQPGDRGIVLVPASLSAARLNIGVRTLGRAVQATVQVFSASGQRRLQLQKDWPADFFEQRSAQDFLDGNALTGGESIEVWLEGGSLFVYGAVGDNVTNDPTLQLAGHNTL